MQSVRSADRHSMSRTPGVACRDVPSPDQYFAPSCSKIAGFSSVDVSCVIASPLATDRSNRRMIFPERVFGRLSPKRISLGLAIGPISRDRKSTRLNSSHRP